MLANLIVILAGGLLISGRDEEMTYLKLSVGSALLTGGLFRLLDEETDSINKRGK